MTNLILDSDAKDDENIGDDDDETFTVGNTESILGEDAVSFMFTRFFIAFICLKNVIYFNLLLELS